MIIAKLMGGLGNQMFQYALGRRLALQHGVPLRFDASFLDTVQPGTTPRAFELGHLATDAKLATPQEIAALYHPARRGLAGKWQRVSDALRPVAFRSHIREHGPAFNARVLQAGPNVYLEGYWQSPYYFEAIADRIRAEFQFIEPPDARNAALQQQINRAHSVAIHVRRAD
ncbi:MAG: hypothetical protein L0Y32_05500, partial [Nevskiales bacterium]|nr:hypothetical protein [Nevskiales bacterium]